MSPRYLVCPTARVRRERFGLLFYDTRSARLTYVASGDGLTPVDGTEPGRRELVVADAEPSRRKALARLLDRLSAKGLIVAVEHAER